MDFNKKINRYKSESEKYDGAKKYFGTDGVTPLWVADMDFVSPSCIQKAFLKRIRHGVYGYTKKDGEILYAISKWLHKRHGYKVETKDIHLASGVVTSTNIAINAFTKEGEGILIQTPIYHPFARSIKANGREVITSPLVLRGKKYEIDFDDLEKKLSQVSMMILCNPHNPTGKVLSKKELMQIGQLCLKKGVVIFSDEIHFDIVFKPHKHIPIASLSKELAQNCLTATAASKSFNVAGCSTSYVICENESLMRRYLSESKKYVADDGNIFGVIATQAAYESGTRWLENLIKYLEQNAKFVTSYIEKNIPQIQVIEPQATYLMWLDFRDTGFDNDTLKKLLWQEAKAGLIDGRVFGKEGDGFFRLNIGTQKRVLKQALRAIKDVL